MPSPVPYRKFLAALKEKGFVFLRTRGSHHMFKGLDGRTISIPVHNNEVKYVYWKKEIESN